MKIDFSKIPYTDIEGNEQFADISKDLGNSMYYNSVDIAASDLGRDIYHQKEVDLTKEQAAMVRPFIEQGYKAIMKRVLLPMLDSIQ